MINDKEMILNPTLWPCPCLPMKRESKDSFPWEIGCLFEGKLTIYIVNMFSLGSMSAEQIKQTLETCKKYEYTSIDHLLSDNWMVD